MANYENIKPYAEFAHEAAQHGGVDNYLNDIAEANQELGILDEKNTEGWKALLVAAVALGLWEGGKAALHGIKKHLEKKKLEATKKAEDAKAAIIEGVNQAMSFEEDNLDVIESDKDITT